MKQRGGSNSRDREEARDFDASDLLSDEACHRQCRGEGSEGKRNQG